ncbi:MAG: insulinase family protein [Clostridia bacterium]|jgi:predicted Zn-dependent peptidase|nr:insulinase family protein [Clostridia bacterium]MCI9412920.1 insulinase family protein [Clostridia bacterium]
MNYQKEEIKQGITTHQIHTENFKTNLYAIFLAIPLEKKTVTLDALIGAVLRRGTKEFQTQEAISKELEGMYGASFNCGIEKTGDNHILKFYLETLSEEFLPEPEKLNEKCLSILFDIAFNPLTINGSFKPEYVEGEKKNLKQIIESKIDNKAKYAYDRCIEEMYKNEPYGLYKFGYIEDIDSITPEKLYKHYQNLLAECKIDIFCSGRLDEKETIKRIKEDKNIQKLQERNPKYVINNEVTENKGKVEENTVEESMQVTQGKLVLGLDIQNMGENSRFIASVYNAILGGGANSKLFQNVREKQSLAYTAGSSYLRTKNSIFIRCGIEIKNYQKALDTIKQQLKDMENGEFSEEDLENAKRLIVASVDAITEEQDTEITYYYGQELADRFISIEDYKKHILEATKEQVTELAKTVQINTIYFLKD